MRLSIDPEAGALCLNLPEGQVAEMDEVAPGIALGSTIKRDAVEGAARKSTPPASRHGRQTRQ